MPQADIIACDVCGGAMRQRLTDWALYCEGCGFWRSTLHPAIPTDSGAPSFGGQTRVAALQSLRLRNFNTILDIVGRLTGNAALSVLDVGCAYGWFLGLAAARGHRAVGIEPDGSVAAVAEAAGCAVLRGFFPACLAGGARYDVIVFNDSFEHIPDPASLVRSCLDHLLPGGLVVVNAPSSLGIFYRTAVILAALGVRMPFNRLWQVGFPSPHLSYFSPSSLSRMFSAAGFRRLLSTDLPSLDSIGSLSDRIRFDPGISRVAAAALCFGLTLSYPILRSLRSDILLGIFQAGGEAAPGTLKPD